MRIYCNYALRFLQLQMHYGEIEVKQYFRQNRLYTASVPDLYLSTGKYRMRTNYRRILQNHIFTNTEQKYMMLPQCERGMFAVSW